MIKEAYCSKEVSELLKEKGFNEPVTELNKLFCKEGEKPVLKITHQKAMKWLREICKLSIEPYVIATEENCIGYAYAICSCKTSLEIFAERWDGKNPFASYEEAVEAALKYSLKNLIQL